MTTGRSVTDRTAPRFAPGEGPPGDGLIRILYIAGCGRSGSTLMMRLLAEATHGVAVGELYHLWQHGYEENFICGCGTRFSECPFWVEVNRRMCGGNQQEVDAAEMRRLQRRVHGPQALLPLRISALRSSGYRAALAEYEQILHKLYNAIAKTAGVSVVIDSSKSPQLARMLGQLSGVEVHVLHLVRDSRASAWSWKRVRDEPALGEGATMHRFPVWRSALEWTANHAILLLDRHNSSSYTMCKYEEFVENPHGELLRALPWMDAAAQAAPGGEYTLQRSHSVTGNPNRFHSGRIEIAADAEWETAMPLLDRVIVTAISWPLLKWFGYPLHSLWRRRDRMPKATQADASGS
jgi:hypothetical protein